MKVAQSLRLPTARYDDSKIRSVPVKIAFYVGSVFISGGSYVIYQHALFAKRMGHDVTIIALYPYDRSHLQWHPALAELRVIPHHEVGNEPFDLAIATWWKTAIDIHKINATQYAYFVQSIETRFYADHEQPLRRLISSTYDLPLPGVTEARWIQRYLRDHHQRDYSLAPNGIRKDLYTESGPTLAARPQRGQLRVLIEGPFGVFFKNVGRSIKLARRAQVGDIWLLTSSEVTRYPGVAKVISRVPIDQVAPIYRSCDVLLKLSYVEGMFGPPLEMFHCGGTAVVYDVTGHDEYIVDGENAIVIPRDDEAGVISALQRLRDDTRLLERLKAGARATAAAWPDWDTASQTFLDVLHQFMHMPPVSRADLKARNDAAYARYVADDRARLARQPWVKLIYAADAFLDKAPKGIARTLRTVRYLYEGWR